MDPGESHGKQRALYPGAVVRPHEMGAQAAVPVPPGVAQCQADPAVLHQRCQRLSCVHRKPRGRRIGPATGDTRCLDASEAHRLSVVEQDRAAVDDFDDVCFRVERKAHRWRH